MITGIFSFGISGTDGFGVRVEVDTTPGLPSFEIVGLPDTAIKESKERVRAAIKNCKGGFPAKRVIVNLSPADVPKSGPIYDLPILLGILAASGQWPTPKEDYGFIGELSLSGEVLPVHGVLPMVLAAKRQGLSAVFIPKDNIGEVQYVTGIEIYPLSSALALHLHLSGQQPILPMEPKAFETLSPDFDVDFSEVKGQQTARRALEIAAAGGHNILMIGPPGSGKSMLAKRLPTILPAMTMEEAMQCTEIYSIAKKLPEEGMIHTRPFRAPHHTMSSVALCGGGRVPRPGEITLAHHGVLFLDELPEFSREALEALRQPLEDNCVTVSRAAGSAKFPANLMLVAAMNPCPCGYLGHPTRECDCTIHAIQSYARRISGPMLDRIDMHVEVPAIPYDQLKETEPAESSAEIRRRVEAAREVQRRRYEGKPYTKNADLSAGATREYCILTEEATQLLGQCFEKMGMSGRAYDRILRLGRTIADLAHHEKIERSDIAEALQYRALDRSIYQ